MNAILGEKVGMTQIFDDEARAIPVTVIKAGPCHVTQIRTEETDGYTAVQLSYGEIAKKSINKPTEGHYAKAGVEPARHFDRTTRRRCQQLRARPGNHRLRGVRSRRESGCVWRVERQRFFKVSSNGTTSPVKGPATEFTRSTVLQVRLVHAPRRHVCSKARSFLVAWAARRQRSSTSPSLV